MVKQVGDMGSKVLKVLNSGVVGNGNGSETPEARTRRFGVFELDLRAGELRRNGMKVKLQEQPFQVLAQLLEKPGEVVTREDLRSRLWPADTFVDFDHSLNAAIKRLRDALGDTAENPRFVETVARRGYRFLAPVSTPSANGDGGGQTSSTESRLAAQPALAGKSARATRRVPIWWTVGGAAAVILVLVGIKLGLSLGLHHGSQIRVSRLTANPAEDRVLAAAISRDGKYLAFSDETGFYLRQIETGETHPMPLPNGLKPAGLSWFPDSAHVVAALNGGDGRSGLWEISTLGGNARKLSDEGRLPEVSPDGREIAFITGKKMNESVWIMGADGTQARKLAGEEGDFFGAVAWSPDGTRVAYTRGRFSYAYGVSGTIELMDLRNQRVSNLLQVTSMGWFERLDGPLAWAPDGHLIYSMSEPPPRHLDSNLWSLAVDEQGKPTGTPVRLIDDLGAVFSITSSASGKRIAYLKGVPQPDVYVARLEGRSLGEPQRLTLDDRQDIPFDWTPDGKSVLFISDRTGTFCVYKQEIDQTVPELLVRGDRPVITPRLSPDGSQLLYLVFPNRTGKVSTTSLMRMPLVGGAPQEVLKANWISNQQCARAPATLCLYSVVSEGALTFFSFDPPKVKGAQVYQIKDTAAHAYNWSLSPDGTTLAIAKGKEGGDPQSRVHLVLLGTNGEKWVTVEGRPGVASLDWGADSKSLWLATVGEEGNALLNVDLQGHVRVAWRPKKMTVGWAIPSRDGRYLALHVGSTSANVWMVERP
jgi:Tol biopolymer transport system component/DNA-binding winged helix-turn-helix (wHTH) protein